MELEEEQLRQKAILLLQRERELFELRTKHEQVTTWLKLTQSLPLLIADRRLQVGEMYARIRKALIEGLRMQRVMFMELDGDVLRPLVPAGSPRAVGPEALALLRGDSAGFCNDPVEEAERGLAAALDLFRLIWSRIEVAGRLPVVLAVGFDRAKAKFQMPFAAADAAHLRNTAQHLQSLLGNMLLVQELERANESLEQRVEDRTRELARRNRDMRLVLDNVAQALVTIDTAGRLAQERSATFDAWFGPYEGTPSFADHMANVDPLFAEMFPLAHEAFADQVLPVEVCLKQLPTRLCAKGHIFHCSYLPLAEGAEGSGLLVVIGDVSEQLRRAQEEAEQSELLAAFQGLTRDREGFLAFFEEANHLVEELARGELEDATRSRYLHTLKGNAAMMGAKVIAELCHRAEDELAMEGADGIESTMKRLEERWAAVRQTIEMVIGERPQGVLEIPSFAVEQLENEVRAGASADHIVRQLTFFRFEPVARPLSRLSQYARSLAQRMGKGELIVTVETGEIRLDARRLGAFWSALVHVVRNAIDHGIEPGDERLARGKAQSGRLTFRAAQRSGDLVIEMRDDGRGIDWRRIRQLAAERGMPHETELDLVRAILSDNFSTCSRVTETSGRGVGMGAVAEEVRALGGTLSVDSEVGTGTCWRMTIPIARSTSLRALPPLEHSPARS